MDTINQLVKDLEKLSKSYEKLSSSHGNLFTKQDVKRFEKGLIEGGKLFVDFYKNSFPKYSKIPNPVIEEVGRELSGISSTASRCLEDKLYFGLSVLLTPRGSMIGDPNYLDIMIKKLKKSKNKKYKE